MGYTVLEASNTDENRIDVLGEFIDREEATKFADDARTKDVGNEFEYSIETPPSRIV